MRAEYATCCRVCPCEARMTEEATPFAGVRTSGDARPHGLEATAVWISPEDKRMRCKGMRNAGVAFAMAKRGGPMKNRRDKRRVQKERRFEESAL